MRIIRKTLATLLVGILPYLGFSGDYKPTLLDSNNVSGSVAYKVDGTNTHSFYTSNGKLYYVLNDNMGKKEEIQIPQSLGFIDPQIDFDGNAFGSVTEIHRVPTNRVGYTTYFLYKKSWWVGQPFSGGYVCSNRCSLVSNGNDKNMLVNTLFNGDIDLCLVNFQNSNGTISNTVKYYISREKIQTQPKIVKNSKGDMFAYWEDKSTNYIKACVSRISSNGLEDIVEYGDYSFDGDITVGKDDVVNVVYKNSPTFPSNRTAMSTILSTTFRSPTITPIKEAETQVGCPLSVTTDEDNTQYVQWSEVTGDSSSLFITSSKDFSKIETIDTGGEKDLGFSTVQVNGKEISVLSNFHSLTKYSKKIKKGTTIILR
jgi:hypothetical protein